MGIGVFDMVVIIVVVSLISGVVTQYLKTKPTKPNTEMLNRIEALEAKVGNDDLETRVQALESIVTDNQYKLKQEFSNLEK